MTETLISNKVHASKAVGFFENRLKQLKIVEDQVFGIIGKSILVELHISNVGNNGYKILHAWEFNNISEAKTFYEKF